MHARPLLLEQINYWALFKKTDIYCQDFVFLAKKLGEK